MILKKTMIKRDIAGETLLVPIGDAMADSNGLFMLTESGSFIWDILPQCESEEEIVKRILDEYEVEEDTAKADVKAFLDKLRSYDIID